MRLPLTKKQKHSRRQMSTVGTLADEVTGFGRSHFSDSSKGGGNPGARSGVPEGICVGSPDQIIEAIKHWESIGVDGINFLLNGLEVIPQEKVLESMRLFAREVMPAFGARP